MTTLSTIINRNDLVKALGHVQRIVEKRNTIPILANVLIEASIGGLEFRATDLDIEASVTALAATKQYGTTTVPTHLLYDIARKFPDGADVSLTVEDEQLLIRSGRSRFKLQSLPAEDFPTLATPDFTHTFKVSGANLNRLLGMSEFAMSNEATRYYLNGIYLHTQTNGNALHMRAAATDGHRLARIEIQAPEGTVDMPGCLLPRKTVGALLKLSEGVDSINVSLSKAKARFEIGKVVLTSKLIDGTFPDYQRVIPTTNHITAVADKQELIYAVERAAVMSSTRSNAIKLEFTIGVLKLSVQDQDSGSAEEVVDVEYDASPFIIGFNSSYLLENLRQIEGDKVKIRMADSGSPAMLEDCDDADAVYVLMPLRVK